VWIAGGGNAEGFKSGPIIGEYVAKRVLGDETDPEIAKQFQIPATEFDPNAPRRGDEE
jgi:glycine/D-amino acid oxidase-like deaminating enzyme